MTSKLGKQAVPGGAKDFRALEKFPCFPPREDMQNSLHLDEPALQAALTEHLGNYDTTIVLSEVPVRWTPSQTRGHRVPDLLVAFNVDRGQAVFQQGYSISDLGKPPDFVLEVASQSTRNRDIGDKRRDYANFGIPEYWRFDTTGGRWYGVPLAGDRLMGEEYSLTELVELEPGHIHGRSNVLNLDLCSHQGRLRWYDPAEQRYLMTYAEERGARMAERQARLAEQHARLEAEVRADAAETRIRELEEELKRREQS